MTSDMKSRLSSCFATIFPDVPAEKLPTLVSRDTDEWDSLATVNLAGVIEEEFDVDVGPDDAQHFVSFEDVEKWLLEKSS